MKKIIKGFHYCFNFLNFKPYFCKESLQSSYKVKFTQSCRYIIGKDQTDVNKLFGFSYGFHHNQSDRIGWRYNNITNKIELLLYSYECKKRYSFLLKSFDINEDIIIKLSVDLKEDYRSIIIEINNKRISYFLKHKQTFWGYTLGSYFGGNRTAPHNILIDIAKL